MTLRLAFVGDIHNAWGPPDNTSFNASDYDAIIVLGDLAGFRFKQTAAIAQQLSALTRPTFLVPGNHDTSHAVQMLAEMLGRPSLGRPFVTAQARNLALLREATSPHTLAAYSSHPVGSLTLIAGRPHTMGGPTLSFAPHLADTWGIHSLEESVERLNALIDESPTEELIFINHNGPAGLGSTRTDLWGCDFKASEGDWGDPDLAEAIAYAKQRGKRVLAVVAGHMHRKLRGGGQRDWLLHRDGTVYVNAALVPRVDRNGRRHHVHLTVEAGQVSVEDRWVGE